MSQLNVSGYQRFDSLSLGERAGERVLALRPGNVCEVPHPNPRPSPGQALLPQGEGARRTDHIAERRDLA